MSSCDTTSTQQECGSQTECCPVEKSLNELCCPTEMSAKIGNKAFSQAMMEVQVESLKAKIKQGWGDKIDKKSDSIVKAMGIHWQAMLDQAKAQKDLREEMSKILFS